MAKEKMNPEVDKPKRERRTRTKDEKVAIVEEAKVAPTIKSIAEKYGMAENLLYRWVKDYDQGKWGPVQSGISPEHQAEVETIRVEIEKHQGQIDRLKMKLADIVLSP